MKITQQDLPLMLITAVSSAMITAAIALAIKPDCRIDIAPPVAGDVSERISWNEATTGRSEYLNFNPLLVKYPDPTGRETIDKLKGFVFEAKHLREITSNNGSNFGNPDKIIFYLSQNGTFVDNSTGTPKEHGNLSLIAVGVKDNRHLIDDIIAGRQASIFDKAVPCPPICPN